jgi:hypothetical protein
MVTKFVFRQDFFGFFKNGQKKCPKLKIPNTFGKRKSLKYNKFLDLLKENQVYFRKIIKANDIKKPDYFNYTITRDNLECFICCIQLL